VAGAVDVGVVVNGTHVWTEGVWST
jgi:hypothetical protein